MKITVQDIMDLRPRIDYSKYVVSELWGDNDHLALCQICDLDIPISDIIYGVTKLMPEREARLFAADCAERVLPVFEAKHYDDRPWTSIECARKYARGDLEFDAMVEAGEMSREALGGTADNSKERCAVWAASYVSFDCIKYGAAMAAEYGERAASSPGSERQVQLELLRGYCEQVEK